MNARVLGYTTAAVWGLAAVGWIAPLYDPALTGLYGLILTAALGLTVTTQWRRPASEQDRLARVDSLVRVAEMVAHASTRSREAPPAELVRALHGVPGTIQPLVLDLDGGGRAVFGVEGGGQGDPDEVWAAIRSLPSRQGDGNAS